MNTPQPHFTRIARCLHWLMAVLILCMLFIGIGMAATLSAKYRFLIAIHRPLGILILVLAAVRLLYRLFHSPPPLPDSLPMLPRFAAKASHFVLYGLMFALPLVGWAMLSAAAYPIVLVGSLRLPPIVSADPALYVSLRHLHTILALLLFATFLAHLGAALLHAWIRRDGVFESMAPSRR